MPRAPLPWQVDSWQHLTRALDGGRLPHALLISGSAGIGKNHFAQALTALLLCQSPEAGTACARCRSCGLLQAGTHTDLLALSLEDGSRQIKVDQIRTLGAFANKTASLGRRKIISLADADSMNLSAANALLKNLEEPSADTHLILVADNLGRLVPTVRSRCQNIALPDPGLQQSTTWLQHICGDLDQAASLLTAARGKPLAAAAMFAKDKLTAHLRLEHGLSALIDGSISPLEFPRLVKDEQLEQVLGLLSQALEQHIRSRVAGGERQLAPQFLALDDLQLIRRQVSAGANPNRQLCIESVAMQLVEVLER